MAVQIPNHAVSRLYRVQGLGIGSIGLEGLGQQPAAVCEMQAQCAEPAGFELREAVLRIGFPIGVR